MSKKTSIITDDKLYESRSHGSADLPCEAYNIELKPDSYEYISWHWHKELELVYIIEGSINVHLPSNTFTLYPGDLIYINSEVLHEITIEDYTNFKSIVFYTDLISGVRSSTFFIKYMRPLLKYRDNLYHIWKFDDHDAAWASKAFTRAHDELVTKNWGYEFVVRESLTQLVTDILKRYMDIIDSNAEMESLSQSRIKNMLGYIHKNYAEPITLSDIAQVASVSERECLRSFKTILHIPPMQYVIKHRITQAATLLKESNSSISEISASCGFDSPSYFTSTFKKHYNCSPKEFRFKFR